MANPRDELVRLIEEIEPRAADITVEARARIVELLAAQPARVLPVLWALYHFLEMDLRAHTMGAHCPRCDALLGLIARCEMLVAERLFPKRPTGTMKRPVIR